MTDELTYMTDAHVAVIRQLERRGFALKEEVDFPPYRVDIYLPDYHAAVEVDGPRHTVKGDHGRDMELEAVYHLWAFHVAASEADRPRGWLEALGAFLNAARESRDERYEKCEMKTPWL